MKSLRSLPGICLLFFIALNPAPAQNSDYESVVNGYVERFKYIAIQEMKTYGIPASITLAQGILESDAGRSELAARANNHFGIKCHKEWTGPAYYKDDDKPDECFRKYSDPIDSYRDHSVFLKTRERYRSLFSLKPDDFESWAAGLKAAGYATNPKYPELLISLIRRFSLDQYDTGEPGIGPVQPALANATDFSGIRYAYFAPGPDGRKTFTNNHTWFVFSGEGESLREISVLFGIRVAKLQRYNDLRPGQGIRPGEPVYLTRKQRKAEVKSHRLSDRQTVWAVSQIYAVRLNKLLVRNGLSEGVQPAPGTLLKLR